MLLSVRRRLGLGIVLLVAALATGVLALVVSSDATAVRVTFVNDSGVNVALPDCSTDLAFIDAGASARLPVVPSNDPTCTVDDAMAGKVIGCVTLPRPLNTSTVIRLSRTHPCP